MNAKTSPHLLEPAPTPAEARDCSPSRCLSWCRHLWAQRRSTLPALALVFVAISARAVEVEPAPAEPSPDPASDGGDDVHAVDAIVVTGSRTERPLGEAPVATEVITREEIDESGAQNLGDLLEEHPGI